MSGSTDSYIVDKYLPELLQRRCILEPGDHSKYSLKSVKVLPVTSDGTFMLTECRRVQVELEECAVKSNRNVLHLNLVIKVSEYELLYNFYII